MALTDPWSGEDDDTGYDYYDTPPAMRAAPAPVPAVGSHQRSEGTRDDYPESGHPAEQP